VGFLRDSVFSSTVYIIRDLAVSSLDNMARIRRGKLDRKRGSGKDKIVSRRTLQIIVHPCTIMYDVWWHSVVFQSVAEASSDVMIASATSNNDVDSSQFSQQSAEGATLHVRLCYVTSFSNSMPTLDCFKVLWLWRYISETFYFLNSFTS